MVTVKVKVVVEARIFHGATGLKLTRRPEEQMTRLANAVIASHRSLHGN